MNLKSLFANILWWLAVAALISAWIASSNLDPRNPGTFLKIQVPYWFWNALILSVLSLGLKVSVIIGNFRQRQTEADKQQSEAEQNIEKTRTTRRTAKIDSVIKTGGR